jgi:hypothetical protein
MRHHRKHTCPGKQEEVTEPPEPFDPDKVGNPEDFDPELARELAEFLESEQFGELADDIIIDEVSRGEDNRTIYDEYDEVEDPLRDDLMDIHEQPNDEPIPELVSTEEAMRIIAEAKKKRDEEKAAAKGRALPEGAEPVAIADDAQQVALIAEEPDGRQAIESAIGKMNDVIAQFRQAGEELSSLTQWLLKAIDHVQSQGDRAGDILGGSTGAEIQGQGHAVGEAINSSLSVIADIDTEEIVQQIGSVSLAELSGRIQAFCNDISNAAAQRM